MTAVETLHGYDVHPIASMFPLIEGQAFLDLVEDIRANGLRDKVTLTKGRLLLDGRNRVRACHVAGVPVESVEFDGPDPVGFAVSHNLLRRHLTDTQRALIAARMANLGRGGDRGNQYVGGKAPIGALPEEPVVTRGQARDLMGVSVGSYDRARVITTSGIPEVVDLATNGQLSLAAGARVASLPEPAQREYIERVNGGESPAAAVPPGPSVKPQLPPAPPKFGPRRTHSQIISAMTSSLIGLAIAADEIKDFDKSITSEEAARLMGDLFEPLRSLNRVKTLLKESIK